MFVFPKPAPESNTSSTDAADVAELLLSLSVFGFSQLSVSDQCVKSEELRGKVVEDVTVEQLLEESEEDFRLRTFTELCKKLPVPDQNQFLSTVTRKFKRDRKIGELISWFSTELDTINQQELIAGLVHVTADDETSEDFRLKRFTQLSKDYTDYVYKHLVSCREEYAWKPKDKEETFDWQSRFSEFFLGFSIIWFKGQSSYGQWQLIEQLCAGVSVITEKLADETEADFRLRRFTELCKEVVDFDVQAQFLDKAEQRLLRGRANLPHGMLLQPQDSASAAQLLSSLSSFGFNLLSPNDQQDKIEQISNKLAAKVIIERTADETEEDLRRKTFTKLFDKAPVSTRVHIFKELNKIFLGERRLCESVLLFRQLDPDDQQERIDEMFSRSIRVTSKDVKDVIVERLSQESVEDFRLKRFIKLCKTHTFLLDRFHWPQSKKWDLKALQQTPGNEERHEIKQSRYADFYLGVSVIWFKTRCANLTRNPIQVLVGKVGERDHIIEKLPNESEEDFRLRRFTESFKQLQFSSQEDVVKYVQDTVVHDLDYRKELKKEEKKDDIWFDGRPPFAPDFIVAKT